MTDFENIISFENLYRAHRRARLSKRHKKEVILFEANLSKNLWELHYDLKYGKYEVGGYHNFMIYDPKEREIQAISYRDRVVQHSLCDNFLTPLLDRILIYDNCACRKNKGTSFAIKRWRAFMTEHYKKHQNSGYFVKIDVHKYFPSIDHDVLKCILSKFIVQDEILTLLYKIINSYNFLENKGLPMGNQSSQCFALLYLNVIDRFVKEKLKIQHYVRYMDDMLFLVENKDKALSCVNEISRLLHKFNLKINPKSQIYPVKCGVSFLGWRFVFLNNGKIIQKLRCDTKKRIMQRVVLYHNLGKRVTNEKLIRVYASYNGYLKEGNAFNNLLKINKKLFKKTA